mgnify:CR=1 FL=1
MGTSSSVNSMKKNSLSPVKFQFLTQSDTPFESDGEPPNGDDVCGAVLFGDGWFLMGVEIRIYGK